MTILIKWVANEREALIEQEIFPLLSFSSSKLQELWEWSYERGIFHHVIEFPLIVNAKEGRKASNSTALKYSLE
jgi:hypothetical protein